MEVEPRLARQRRRHPADPVHGRRGGNIAEVPLDQAPSLVRVDVAGYRDSSVGGRVEAPEEGLHVVEGRRVQVLLRAYDRPAVWMRRGEEHRLEQQVRRAVGPVLVALPGARSSPRHAAGRASSGREPPTGSPSGPTPATGQAPGSPTARSPSSSSCPTTWSRSPTRRPSSAG